MLSQGVEMKAPDLLGLSILVVEDEPLVAMLIEDQVQELGCTLAASASTTQRALELLHSRQFGLALLDIQLRDETSAVLAIACKQLGIPVVFATGYVASDVPEGCAGGVILAKPFSTEELAVAMQGAIREQAMDLRAQARA